MDDIVTRYYYGSDANTGKEASVVLTVDMKKLADELVMRAVRSKGGKAVSLNGAVMAKVKEVRRQGVQS